LNGCIKTVQAYLRVFGLFPQSKTLACPQEENIPQKLEFHLDVAKSRVCIFIRAVTVRKPDRAGKAKQARVGLRSF